MDAGQIISIAIQAVVMIMAILGGVTALSGRLARMEGKLDSFASSCLLKHIRVDEKLAEGKTDVNSVGAKLDTEIGKVTKRFENLEEKVKHD